MLTSLIDAVVYRAVRVVMSPSLTSAFLATCGWETCAACKLSTIPLGTVMCQSCVFSMMLTKMNKMSIRGAKA